MGWKGSRISSGSFRGFRVLERCLLLLGGLGYDRQVLYAGVVAGVVGDERETVLEGGCGDPGVS